MNLMQFRRWAIPIAIIAQCSLGPLTFAQTTSGAEHWVATWTAAAQSGKPELIRRNAPTPTQTAAPRPITSLKNQTARMVAHTAISGRRVRIQLSNTFGGAPLRIGSAHIALRSKDSAVVPGSDRTLTFSGHASFLIPVGVAVVSDAVNLEVPKGGDLLVSVYVPDDTGPATLHSTGLHTTYIKDGDTTAAAEMASAATSLSFYLLSDVEVVAPANSFAVVTVGDSITDGSRSTPNANASWPSFLAARMLSNPATAHIAVVNEGIAGNRILRDVMGPSPLSRFDRDVIAVPGVKWLMLLVGINDIGGGDGEAFFLTPPPHPEAESPSPKPDDLIYGYRQMIERAHAHGIKVAGCTLPPFEGAFYYTDKGNETRLAVNQWIRTSKAFDAVVDFDAAIRNPEKPNYFRAEYDSGDHLHPGDAGYKAMADAVDLGIFESHKGVKVSRVSR